jgi:hypothetical protein
LVAPIAGVIVLSLIFVDGPVRARWAVSRHAFESVMRAAMEEETRPDFEAVVRERLKESGDEPDVETVRAAVDEKAYYLPIEHGRVGLYTIDYVYREGDEFLFYRYGDWALGSTEAGFAFLPRFPEQVVVPDDATFRHLGGHWYAWTGRTELL